MQKLAQVEQDILTTGRVDSNHLEALRLALYAGGKVGRPGADFLIDLHKRVGHLNPAFQQFYYRAIKDHVLVDGRIDAEEAAWLRKALFADGKIKDEERKFLHELKGEAGQKSREFDALFTDAMKMPQESHTSGTGK
jgi:hypothetical protein